MTSAEATIFYNKYKQRLFNTAMRIAGDAFDAQEVVQNTVIKYLRFEQQGRMNLVPEQVDAWLHRTCTREAIDMLRQRKALNQKLEEMASQPRETEADGWEQVSAIGEHGADGWESVLADGSRRQIERIKAGIIKLPHGYRVVLSLVLFEGYDYEECAQILGVSQSTVRSQYLRAKNRLLELINSQDNG